jgi:hypothetical protein
MNSSDAGSSLMGEIEHEVRAEVRFEVADGMFKSLSVGQVLSDSLFNQNRFSAHDIPMGKPVGGIVAGHTFVVVASLFVAAIFIASRQGSSASRGPRRWAAPRW